MNFKEILEKKEEIDNTISFLVNGSNSYKEELETKLDELSKKIDELEYGNSGLLEFLEVVIDKNRENKIEYLKTAILRLEQVHYNMKLGKIKYYELLNCIPVMKEIQEKDNSFEQEKLINLKQYDIFAHIYIYNNLIRDGYGLEFILYRELANIIANKLNKTDTIDNKDKYSNIYKFVNEKIGSCRYKLQNFDSLIKSVYSNGEKIDFEKLFSDRVDLLIKLDKLTEEKIDTINYNKTLLFNFQKKINLINENKTLKSEVKEKLVSKEKKIYLEKIKFNNNKLNLVKIKINQIKSLFFVNNSFDDSNIEPFDFIPDVKKLLDLFEINFDNNLIDYEEILDLLVIKTSELIN